MGRVSLAQGQLGRGQWKREKRVGMQGAHRSAFKRSVHLTKVKLMKFDVLNDTFMTSEPNRPSNMYLYGPTYLPGNDSF